MLYFDLEVWLLHLIKYNNSNKIVASTLNVFVYFEWFVPMIQSVLIRIHVSDEYYMCQHQ